MPPTALSPSKALTSTHSRGFDDTSTAAASLPNPPSHKAERGIYSEMLSQNEGQVGAESMLIEEARMQQLPPVSEEEQFFANELSDAADFLRNPQKWQHVLLWRNLTPHAITLVTITGKSI